MDGNEAVSALKGLGIRDSFAVALIRHGGRCAYCGRDLVGERLSYASARTDHLLPKGQFPDLANHKDNWVLSCSVCNGAKRDWFPGHAGDAGSAPRADAQRGCVAGERGGPGRSDRKGKGLYSSQNQPWSAGTGMEGGAGRSCGERRVHVAGRCLGSAGALRDERRAEGKSPRRTRRAGADAAWRTAYSQACAQVCRWPRLAPRVRGGGAPALAVGRCGGRSPAGRVRPSRIGSRGGRGSTSRGGRSRSAASSRSRAPVPPASRTGRPRLPAPCPPRPRGRGGCRRRRLPVQTAFPWETSLWTVGARPSGAAPTGCAGLAARLWYAARAAKKERGHCCPLSPSRHRRAGLSWPGSPRADAGAGRRAGR